MSKKEKSIIIFGKGPSVLNCTREIVDSYEDIAIINYPVLNDFFYSLIKDRIINHHFCNFGTFDTRYNNKINKDLKIQKLYNTNRKKSNGYLKFLKNKSILVEYIKETGLKNFKKLGFEKYEPCSGILALNFIVNLGIYNKICLVGFDGFEQGKKIYYFDFLKEANPQLKYLIGEKIYSKEGDILKPPGHNPEKGKKYIEMLKNDPNLIIKINEN